jgi:beta-1,4-mannosyl-glycoprotein beta-1,4-N-acetylglucosaminyltransferase
LTGDPEKDHWDREAHTRNAIMQGLKNCQNDDIVFISDLDEIPNANAVRRIQEYFKQFNGKSLKHIKDDTQFVCGLDMRLFMYSMNRENLAGWYGGSKATPYWMVCRHTPWGIKLFHHKYSMHKIPNAGWHFNTMGGMNLSLYKWLYTGPIYYPGTEKALLELANKPELLEQSYRGQVESNTLVVPIDDSFPKYFLQRLDHFRELGWISEL